MKKILLLCTFLFAGWGLKAQTLPWSQRMANTAIHIWKDSLPGTNWSYDQGIVLQGLQSVWQQSAQNEYFGYIQKSMDRYVGTDGSIRTYKAKDYTLDNILSGRSLLFLNQVLGAGKYYKAASLLRKQLDEQPKTPEGGFWHKKRYPNQMWLDGLYMAEPFYAEYASVYHEDADFDQIADQFILMERHARDSKTGLLYHAWDQSKKERWANPQTGLSASLWARADGWYAMALVDVLPFFPVNHPKRAALMAILNRLAVAIQSSQDSGSGLWYQVLDKGGKNGNYLEASASCMFVYTLAKGVREGYLPQKYLPVAQKAYDGIIKNFIETDADGQVNIKGTAGAVGVGGEPYRDGSYEYYTGVKTVVNETKGVGAFMLASVEIERLTNLNLGKGKTVLLDSYFNNEYHKDVTGKSIPFHYKWDEQDNNGFSFFGQIFNNYGLHTKTLNEAPDAENLKKAAAYVIVDPDIPKENPDAKYMEDPHINAISNWVKNGGVLVVLNNDTGNAEFVHLNKLMAKFGISFNLNSVNRVVGRNFEQGAINIPQDNAIFKTARKIYIKELSTLQLTNPAVAQLVNGKDVIVATAKYGKGTVFAVGDPWFYNEYTDGRKLPPDYDNFKAANDLVNWLVKQIPQTKNSNLITINNMILSRYNLNKTTVPATELPPANVFDLPEKVLQFGTGVLLRGLPDYFIDKANRAGIFNGRVAVVKSTDKGSTTDFDMQDGLYTIYSKGIENGEEVNEQVICSAISRVLSASSEWEEILEIARSKDLQVVISNTTEVGIQLVKEDVRKHPPASFPGKLLAILYERYRAFNGRPDTGLVIVPTELIIDNGKKLESIVLELAHLNKLEPAFMDWLESSNSFCNSLVDRIVPGRPDQQLSDAMETERGYTDNLSIMSETYSLWAIQGDEKIAEVLSFAQSDKGVVITPDIELFRELKLRLLNGTHTLSCAVAYLSGFKTVKEAMDDVHFTKFITQLMFTEIMPSIPYQIDEDVARDFGNKVLDRFRNPNIRHEWLSISVQYATKIKMRVIPLLLNYYKQNNKAPQMMALGFAAFIRFMQITETAEGKYTGTAHADSYTITDDQAATLGKAWSRADAETAIVAILKKKNLWDTDLTTLPGFTEAVTRQFKLINEQGELAISAI